MGLRHLLHVKSSATASTSPYVGKPKMPTASDIEYGEIALNYLKGAESAFIKNSSNEIVKLNDVSTITSGTTKLGDVLDGHLNKIITSVTLNTVGQTITTGDSGASLALTVSASDGLTTDKNTVKHSSVAPATKSGFLKVSVDNYGHVTGSTAVTSADTSAFVAVNIAASDGLSASTSSNITTIKHSSKAATTSGFVKVGFDTYGHVTSSTAVTSADISGFTSTLISAGSGLTSTTTNGVKTIGHGTTAAATTGFVKVGLDTYGHVTSSTAVTSDDINGLVGTRYVYVSGDTMTGKLNINNGGLAVSGATSLNGNVTVTGTVTSSGGMYSSDRRLKENINEISCDAIDKVSKVDLKSYNFIADDNKTVKYGVIAQELEEVGLNELVGEHDGRKGVDYIAFLVLKIAQLEKEIEDLKKK